MAYWFRRVLAVLVLSGAGTYAKAAQAQEAPGSQSSEVSEAVSALLTACLQAQWQGGSVIGFVDRDAYPTALVRRVRYRFLKQGGARVYRLTDTNGVFFSSTPAGCHIVSEQGRGTSLRSSMIAAFSSDPDRVEHRVQAAPTRNPDTVRDLWCVRPDDSGRVMGILATSERDDAEAAQGADLFVTTSNASNSAACDLTPVR